jgi:tetratricopeptide (TPR) repeat protein
VSFLRGAICGVLLGICALSCALDGEALSEHEKADLFAKAKEAFAEGNELRAGDAAAARRKYALAAALFERIAQEGGVRNGKLYYNVGNAYFLQDRIGEAILNYRKAERLIPRHADLRKNLKAARILRKDQIETPARKKVMEVLFFWHYDLSLFARFVLFIVCFNAVWILSAVPVLRRNVELRVPILAAAVLFTRERNSLCSTRGETGFTSNSWTAGPAGSPVRARV